MREIQCNCGEWGGVFQRCRTWRSFCCHTVKQADSHSVSAPSAFARSCRFKSNEEVCHDVRLQLWGVWFDLKMRQFHTRLCNTQKKCVERRWFKTNRNVTLFFALVFMSQRALKIYAQCNIYAEELLYVNGQHLLQTLEHHTSCRTAGQTSPGSGQVLDILVCASACITLSLFFAVKCYLSPLIMGSQTGAWRALAGHREE